MENRARFYLLLVVLIASIEVSIAFCPLCETQSDLPKRFNFVLSDGRTCKDIYIDLGQVGENDEIW